MLFRNKFILVEIQCIMPKESLPDPQSAWAPTKGTVSYGSPWHGVIEESVGSQRSGEKTRRSAIDFSLGELNTITCHRLSLSHSSCPLPFSLSSQSRLKRLGLCSLIEIHLSVSSPEGVSPTLSLLSSPTASAFWLWPDPALIKPN